MRMRKGWMVIGSLQVKYLFIVVLAMITPALMVGLGLYSVVAHLLAEQMAFPEAIAAHLPPVIRRVNWVLLVSLPLVACLILWFAAIVSHRFTGPIERLERELDRVIGGGVPHEIHVRRSDDLQSIAERINRLLAMVRRP